MNNSIEKKLLTKRFGFIDPMSIEDYTASGGYEALSKALSMAPEKIVEEVKASGLRGRGGAAFPVGLKMEMVQKAKSDVKYIICNADEGEPGNFKDRYLMENDPHQIIEGMIISAYATGASKGYIFIRGEYTRSIYVMDTAIKAARGKGFLGEKILGTKLSFDIELDTGAGSYVCGEEFALMLCIEGNPARSTFKPPFPTEEGLYGKPTQINNVESLANIPHIIQDGAKAFAKIGTKHSKGTKLVSLSGNVREKGMFEVPFGVHLWEIIENLGRGVLGSIKMVQVGGASGPCLPPNMLGIKLDYKDFADNGMSFGSGAVIVIDTKNDVLDIVRNTLEFFRHESCGKCTPCREGIVHLLILLDRFILGEAEKKDLELMKTLIRTIEMTSICGLGQAAPTALKTTMQYFPEAYAAGIKKHHARAI
jgi:NADH:ubiquinone oxidoreductase subunit F (NADH-binding)